LLSNTSTGANALVKSAAKDGRFWYPAEAPSALWPYSCYKAIKDDRTNNEEQ
jgi:hypothetical protein